jgi:hypothetical protein
LLFANASQTSFFGNIVKRSVPEFEMIINCVSFIIT